MAEINIVISPEDNGDHAAFVISGIKMLHGIHHIHHADVLFHSLKPHACRQATQSWPLWFVFSSASTVGKILGFVYSRQNFHHQFPTHKLAATAFRACEGTTTIESGRDPHVHICSL